MRICVEVDLEKGLLEALQINLDGWSHHQTLDYEQILYKYNACHVYGHFCQKLSKNPRGATSVKVTIQKRTRAQDGSK